MSDKPILVFSAMPRDIVPEAIAALAHARIPVLQSPTRLARAAALLADYAAQRERAGAVTDTPAIALQLPRSSGTLNEAQSKVVLKAAGIAATRDVVLPLDMDASFSCSEIKFPVAIKVLSAQIAHKTDIGGVALNIRDREGLRAAVAAVVANARRAHPAARLDGVLASEMIDDAIEVIVGVVNDSVFGPVVLLGIGGILAEAINDVTYRVAPFEHTEARSMIGDLRATRIFDGLRGRAPSDVDALADVLVNVSRLAWQERERLVELDINPLMVRPEGRGAVAADALVVLRE
jgi:acetyltransferase